MILPIKLVFLVGSLLWFFQTPAGKKMGKFLPTPFWVYFLSILASTFHLLPNASPVYQWIGLHALAAALILMLIGTPVSMVFRLGPKALAAVGLGMGSMFIGTLVSFVLVSHWLPEEGPKMAGALLATWTGGSANLISVKEVLNLSDQALGPLIVTDTFLSYGWLALLMMGVAYQRWFDKDQKEDSLVGSLSLNPASASKLPLHLSVLQISLVVAFGWIVGDLVVFFAEFISRFFDFLSHKGWTVLLATTVAVLMALTPLSRLEKKDASKIGTFILYIVLATIGAKTDLTTALDAKAIFVFGMLVLSIHGILLFGLGRLFSIPLFLLATGSQANVGGAVSAPLVAAVYRPGAAQVGVLMALLGAILGTYVGTFGGWVCQQIQNLLG